MYLYNNISFYSGVVGGDDLKTVHVHMYYTFEGLYMYIMRYQF